MEMFSERFLFTLRGMFWLDSYSLLQKDSATELQVRPSQRDAYTTWKSQSFSGDSGVSTVTGPRATHMTNYTELRLIAQYINLLRFNPF